MKNIKENLKEQTHYVESKNTLLQKQGGISRRHLIKGAAAGLTAFTVVPRRALGGPRHTPPSEKIVLAGVIPMIRMPCNNL